MSAPIGAKSAPINRNPIGDGHWRKSAPIPSLLGAPMGATAQHILGVRGVSRRGKNITHKISKTGVHAR